MIKSTFGERLDALIHRVFPFLFVRRIDPNLLTVCGAVVSAAAAVAFMQGRFPLGGVLILAGGFFDLVDGVVARHHGISTRFGAFLDSTMDRLVDMALFLGLMLHFATAGQTRWVLLTGVASIATVLVSYAQAKAEAAAKSASAAADLLKLDDDASGALITLDLVRNGEHQGLQSADAAERSLRELDRTIERYRQQERALTEARQRAAEHADDASDAADQADAEVVSLEDAVRKGELGSEGVQDAIDSAVEAAGRSHAAAEDARHQRTLAESADRGSLADALALWEGELLEGRHPEGRPVRRLAAYAAGHVAAAVRTGGASRTSVAPVGRGPRRRRTGDATLARTRARA